jgi:molecular chaperone HscB
MILSLTNYFHLFNLPQHFALDRNALNAAYRELAARVHPDKFANASEADRRAAMQWATTANEAYAALKLPIARATHLLALAGHDIGAHSNTAMPRDFLMQQMEWREALAEARTEKNEEALNALEGTVLAAHQDKLNVLEQLLDQRADYPSAVGVVRELLFIDKFRQEVAQALDALTV